MSDLILDGMLQVEIDDEPIAELGPGAIVGERAVLEGGAASATLLSLPVGASATP